MSAFVVSTEHIDVLLKAGFTHVNAGPIQGHRLSWFSEDPKEVGFDQAYKTRCELDFANATEVGQMLMQENVASVCARYEQDTADEYERQLSYRYRDPRFSPTPGEVLKAIACYEYQSCEHDGWEGSQAQAFCEALKNEIMHILMPDEAPWDWGSAEIAKRRKDASAV